MNATASGHGAGRSGMPRSAVSIASACSSGPAMRPVPDVGVACRSWKVEAVAPTTTTRPRNALAGTRPAITSLKWYVGTVPGAPGKSMRPRARSSAARETGCPAARATATGNVSRPSGA